MSGNIYFLTDGELIKVGYAVNVEERIAAIQCGNGRKIEKVCSAPGTIKLERSLHTFLPDRRQGEWFGPSPKLLRLIALVATTPPSSRHLCVPHFIAQEREKRRRFKEVRRLQGERISARFRHELQSLVAELQEQYGAAELAKAIGYTEGAVRFWSSGKSQPGSHAVACLGTYFPERVTSLFRLAQYPLARAEKLGIAA